MSVIILAKFTAAEEHLETVLQHIKSLTDHALHHEPGTRAYTPAQDPEDPLKFTVWEEYESKEAHQAHNAAPPCVAFKASLDKLVAGGLQVERLRPLQT